MGENFFAPFNTSTNWLNQPDYIRFVNGRKYYETPYDYRANPIRIFGNILGNCLSRLSFYMF